MKYHRLFLAILLIPFSALIASPLPAQDRVIKITGDEVNIRTAPKVSSAILSQCKKGDLFKLTAEEGRWYHISMFSGEGRYVHKSLAEVTTYHVVLPDLEFALRSVFNASLESVLWSCRDAERRASREASEKYPDPADISESMKYENILKDRYTLAIFKYFRIQPASYNKIVVEVIKTKHMK